MNTGTGLIKGQDSANGVALGYGQLIDITLGKLVKCTPHLMIGLQVTEVFRFLGFLNGLIAAIVYHIECLTVRNTEMLA